MYAASRTLSASIGFPVRPSGGAHRTQAATQIGTSTRSGDSASLVMKPSWSSGSELSRLLISVPFRARDRGHITLARVSLVRVICYPEVTQAVVIAKDPPCVECHPGKTGVTPVFG